MCNDDDNRVYCHLLQVYATLDESSIYAEPLYY